MMPTNHIGQPHQMLINNLYKERLNNLDKTLLSLHDCLLGDETLKILQKDTSMTIYKIDRINQIVVEVMNSEKQKIIISMIQHIQYLEQCNKQLVQKCSKENHLELQKNNHHSNEKRSNYAYSRDGNFTQNQTLIKQQEILQNLQLRNQNQIIKKQNEQLIKKLMNLEYLSKDLVQKQEQSLEKDKNRSKQLQQMKIQSLKYFEEMQILKMENQKLSKLVQSLNESKTNERPTKEAQKFNKRQKMIEQLRIQIKRLTFELSHLESSFLVIKEQILKSLMMEISEIKKYLSSMKSKIRADLKLCQESLMNDMTQILINRKESKDNGGIDKMATKLNEIDNELDYFIESRILI